jgi:hypothetical protein
MEEPSARIAKSEFRRFGNAYPGNEAPSPRRFALGNPKELPCRKKVVAGSAEIFSGKHERIRKAFGGGGDQWRHSVGDNERHDFETGGIFEFSGGRIGMVDVAVARSKRTSGMLVPVEKIERVREGIWFAGLFDGTLGSRKKEHSFRFGKIAERLRKMLGHIRFPNVRPNRKLDRRRVDLLERRIREVFKRHPSVLDGVSARKPESSGFAVLRNRFRMFQLPKDAFGVRRRQNIRLKVAEFAGLCFFAETGEFVISIGKGRVELFAVRFRTAGKPTGRNETFLFGLDPNEPKA